jgi:predicted amidohydrolase
MNSVADIDRNIDKASAFIREAAGNGAQFIATPENTCYMKYPLSQKRDATPKEGNHPALSIFPALAKDLGITLLVGSICIHNEEDKIINRSYLFNAQGKVQATYDKIHLFDANLPGGEVYKESDIVTSGNEAVTSRINNYFVAGMSVCYDLRFAYLYRSLAHAGANLMCIPSAFTVPTGRAHWEILQRARAIETGSFVIAPAQVGMHEGERKTFGHSMIISPWGRILAQKEEGEGIIMADLDITEVGKARTALPQLSHDRKYSVRED